MQPYFWTGGRVQHASRSVVWPSGRTTSQHSWSAGQPNNAEGNEDCLAIIVKEAGAGLARVMVAEALFGDLFGKALAVGRHGP